MDHSVAHLDKVPDSQQGHKLVAQAGMQVDQRRMVQHFVARVNMPMRTDYRKHQLADMQVMKAEERFLQLVHKLAQKEVVNLGYCLPAFPQPFKSNIKLIQATFYLSIL